MRNDLWEADDHCFAKPGPAGRMRFDAELPPDRTDDIEFLDRRGIGRPPAYNRHGTLDPQTLRGVRRISDSTAALFDAVLSTQGAQAHGPPCETELVTAPT